METKNDTICSKCNTAVADGQTYTICQGFCTDAYHAECVKLTDADVLSFKRNRCIWWLCVSCTSLMSQIRNDKSLLSKRSNFAPEDNQSMNMVLANDILELKKEIAIIQRTIADQSDRTATTTSINDSPPLARSSPKSNRKLMHGSKCSNDSSSISSVPRDKVWLFFTRLRNTVSENQMLRMVSTAIGSKNVIVKKLVADWKDVSTMPYVSFKIGIEAEFRNIAMRRSTWPVGVCYREFYNEYDIWEPE